jgi:hypothetical protein
MKQGAMIAFYFHFPNMNFSHFFFCTFTDIGTTSQSEAFTLQLRATVGVGAPPVLCTVLSQGSDGGRLK